MGSWRSELQLSLRGGPGSDPSRASTSATRGANAAAEKHGDVQPLAMQRVLVIEDEPDIAELIRLHLRDLNLQVTTATDGKDGLARALHDRWDLVVLDLSLPGVDGIDICRRLRDADFYTPVLMLTARAAEYDRVIGLDAGADDYLPKPFSVLELQARVRAILRRVAHLGPVPGEAAKLVRIGELEVDLEARTVRRSGVMLNFTAREFDLLAHFVRHPGKVFGRSQLLDQVWGLTQDAYEHAVSSHINRLRAKLEPDPAQPRYLVTVWGVGYRFVGQ